MIKILNSDAYEIISRLDHNIISNLTNKHILIVGGNGFLGTYFTQTLQSEYAPNCKITVLDTNIYSNQINTDKIKFIKHDITIPYETNEPIDYILAAASIASPKVYKKYPIKTMDVGYIGLKNCLNLARDKNAKLLFFSSSEIYGTADITPTPETYIGAIPSMTERSCYDLSKLIGECLVYNYTKIYNTNACSVRIFNAFSAMHNDGRVIPNFMTKIVNNEELEVYNNGNQTRCFTYITDIIVGCLLALIKGKSSEIYNIGNPNDEVSILQLIDIFKLVIDKEIKFKIIEYPENYAGIGDPTKRVPDISKAKIQLGYEPQVSLKEGLSRMWGWAKYNY